MEAGISLIDGPVAGAAVGLSAGLLGDMLAGRLVGLGALALGGAGLLGGFLGGSLFRENLLVPYLAGALITVVYDMLFVLGARAFGVKIPFGESLVRALLPSLWYNGLLAGLLFPVVQKTHRWLSRI